MTKKKSSMATQIEELMAVLRGTEVTGIEYEGIKITRDPRYLDQVKQNAQAKPYKTSYTRDNDDIKMWNGLHNTD